MNEQLTILLHVVLASFLAGIIGLERESYQKPAGLRTNMIVGGAVALLVSLGEVIVIYFQGLGISDLIRTDPIRIIQAIVVGVSFIGAGTVLQIEREYKIKFLTTAATILFSTGIGIAVALHQYILACGVSVFILIINWVIRIIETRILQRRRKK
jgi:putative Mg2+ transporter-C (MgtC) family protein